MGTVTVEVKEGTGNVLVNTNPFLLEPDRTRNTRSGKLWRLLRPFHR